MNVFKLILLMSFFCFGAFVNAQTNEVEVINPNNLTKLAGTVFDQHGAVIPRIKISITAKKMNIPEIVTNDEGAFSVYLQPGDYKIKAQNQGFETFTIESFRVVPLDNGKMSLDFGLEALPTPICILTVEQ